MDTELIDPNGKRKIDSDIQTNDYLIKEIDKDQNTGCTILKDFEIIQNTTTILTSKIENLTINKLNPKKTGKSFRYR
ncbi:hypothetical protein Gotur_032759 [Gossypium turneri]